MSTKYKFVLKCIDTDVIHKNFGIHIDSTERYTTDINDLNAIDIDSVSFLDESKKSHTCMVSMIDINKYKNTESIDSVCFWCCHPFDWPGIGCPIAYNSSQISKTYYSTINKNTYTIKESVCKKYDEELHIDKGSYITDGIFCSFNCVQAWINSNKHIRLYDMSTTLLLKLYKDITNKNIKKIVPAPHWRILKTRGGTEDITDFRKNFNKVEYEDCGSIIIKPRAVLFEKKFNF